MSTLIVRYSCFDCGLEDATVEVPARDPKENVVTWVQRVGALAGLDHARRSPSCHPQQLHNLKIPLPKDADFIGQPIKH